MFKAVVMSVVLASILVVGLAGLGGLIGFVSDEQDKNITERAITVETTSTTKVTLPPYGRACSELLQFVGDAADGLIAYSELRDRVAAVNEFASGELGAETSQMLSEITSVHNGTDDAGAADRYGDALDRALVICVDYWDRGGLKP